jgi:DNA-binding beta-propeller fold protein YncE
VYVAARKSRAVAIFLRDANTGMLSQRPGAAACVSDAGGGCAPARGLHGARGVDVSPDGRNVYVGAYSADAVAVFSRDRFSGSIVQLRQQAGCVSNAIGRHRPPTTPGCARGRGLNGAWGVTVSPDGRTLYAGAQINNGLAIFARKP